MKTKLFTLISWIACVASTVGKWGLNVDLLLTPVIWLFLAVAVLAIPSAQAALTTNSWMQVLDGKWENAGNWSLGAPIASNGADIITNASTKIVTIDAHTVTSPSTMTISNLTILAPGTDVNTLQLTNAGTATPLHVLNGFNLGTNAALLVTNSAIQVDGLSGSSLIVDGSVTNLAGGQIIATNLTVGSLAKSRGEFTTMGGFLQASNLAVVGSVAGSDGTLTVAGGTNEFDFDLTIGQLASATGAVWVTGGWLYVRPAFNSGLIIGNFGVGQMTVSNGTVEALAVQLGPNGGQGTLTIAGGTMTLDADLTLGNFVGSGGAAWITGGQLAATNGSITIANAGNAQMTVSNGTVVGVGATIGGNSLGHGTLTVAGGVMGLNSLNVSQAPGSTATVWITSGQLLVTNRFFAADAVTLLGRFGQGRLTVSNGQFVTTVMLVGEFDGSGGTLTVAGGNVSCTNVILGSFDCAAIGTVVVAGGNLFVTNAAGNAVLEVRTGSLVLTSGMLTVDRLVMTNACASFVRTGGTLVYGTAVLDPNRDDDGDGIPNGYEQSHGLDPLNSINATQDSDGDGMTDLQEYLAGTDPTNNASTFRITSVVKTGSNVLVTWMMGAGKTNALQWTAGTGGGGYATNSFTNLFIVTNTVGTITNYLDVGGATNMTARYYRVRLVP